GMSPLLEKNISLPSKQRLTSKVNRPMMKSTTVYLAPRRARGWRIPPGRRAQPAAEMAPADPSRDRPTDRGGINMRSTNEGRSEVVIEAPPTPAGVVPAE